MKWVFGMALVLSSVLASVLFMDTQPVLRWLSQRVYHTFYNKDVIVSGHVLLSREDVLLSLPQRRSVLWWLTHKAEVAEILKRNPRVVRAEVRGCERLSWRCFEVELKERVPSLVAVVDQETWLVGDDGSFMNRLNLNRGFLVMVSGRPLPVVQGVAGERYSPEFLRDRLFHLNKAMNVIEAHTDLQLNRVQLGANGEVTVSFVDNSFVGVFDFSQADLNSIMVQADRLKKILHEFGPGRPQLAKVDLAFNKQAVVTMVQ